MSRIPVMTPKKTEILGAIGKRNADGTTLDVEQIANEVSYKPTRQAVTFSIKFLMLDGLVEKREKELRRGQQRPTYALTSLGYEYFNKGV